MGKQGWNVNQAREIPGVVSIEFDDYSSMFTIRAEVSICTHVYVHVVVPVFCPHWLALVRNCHLSDKLTTSQIN